MTPPHPLGDTRKHLTLIRSMAAQTGADMELAYAEGALTADGWAAAVNCCRTCDWAEGCEKWLAQDAERPRAVPSRCANASLMRALKLPG